MRTSAAVAGQPRDRAVVASDPRRQGHRRSTVVARRRLAGFTSSRVGDKNQIFAISPQGGEAVQLTAAQSAVSGFSWSPDSKKIAFVAPASPPADEVKAAQGTPRRFRGRAPRVHARAHLEHRGRRRHARPAARTQHTKDKQFSVGGFSWSPDAKTIAFSATVNPDLIQGGTSDIYVLTLSEDK